MQYAKFISGDTTIEFHNNWLGEETVIVRGKVVSKKSSFFGTSHYFTLSENGEEANYILTTKMTDMGSVGIDLSRNGKMLERDAPLKYNWSIKPKIDKRRKIALQKLNDYDLEAALQDFKTLLKEFPDDADIHFHMACAYSVMENAEEGFKCLKLAVQYDLSDPEAILEHDMLAYLRLQEGFEQFLDSGFKDLPG
jgi:tetratricopeptide (TPR) repeat protein